MGPLQVSNSEGVAQALYKKSDTSLMVGHKNKSHSVMLEKRQAELRKDYLRVMENHELEARKLKKELGQFNYWQENKNKKRFIILPLMEDEFGTNMAKHVNTPREDFYRSALAEIRKVGAMERWDLQQAKTMDIKVHETVNVKISPTIKEARYKVQKYSLHRRSVSAFGERARKTTEMVEGLARSNTLPLIGRQRTASTPDTFMSDGKIVVRHFHGGTPPSVVIPDAFTGGPVDPLVIIRKRCENRKVFKRIDIDGWETILDLQRAYGVEPTGTSVGDSRGSAAASDTTERVPLLPAIDSHIRASGQRRDETDRYSTTSSGKQLTTGGSSSTEDKTRDEGAKEKWSSIMPRIKTNSILQGTEGGSVGVAADSRPKTTGSSLTSVSSDGVTSPPLKSKTVRFTVAPESGVPAELGQLDEKATIWKRLRTLKISEKGGNVEERVNRRRPSVQLKSLVQELLKNRATSENMEYERLTGKSSHVKNYDDVRYLRQYSLRNETLAEVESDEC